jgi:GT2 family glycosyltransferase
MSDDDRRFSVVVPTRDRNDLLAECLGRLAPDVQRYPGAEYEVIVSDDSPSEAARMLVGASFPWARWVAGPRRGPAANRNRGASAATGETLVFIDDDCLPEPDLLREYASALRSGVAVYEGRITCKAGVTSPMQTAPENLSGGSLWSCNFAMRRSAFAALGGFDDRFPLAHMEDVDMRDRILATGHSIEFVPLASVDHPPRRLPFGAKLARMHRAGVLYMVLHPPMRGLPWFVQNTFRARVSRVVRLPKSLDSLIALASVPFELATIASSWRTWMRWARAVAAGGR